MNETTLKKITEKTAELTAIPYCAPEIKAAADKMLSSLGTAGEADALNAYFETLRACIMPIDTAIAFADSPKGKEILGEAAAAEVVKASKARKEKGETNCGCAACSLAAEILKLIS